MTKLSQIIAIEKGVKSKAYSELNASHQAVAKAALLSGLTRTYLPKDDDGEQLPPESTRAQLKAHEVVGHVAEQLTRLFDVTATKDWANCVAKADVVIDGAPLIKAVPVTYLLFLEKQLNDVHTFVSKLPILDPAESWTYDPATSVFKSEPVRTIKTKKVPRNHVKAEATDRHPAQVDVYYEDVPVGYWTTVKFSGALMSDKVNELTQRVLKLIEAVKMAREEANGAQVVDKQVGEVVFGYLFG